MVEAMTGEGEDAMKVGSGEVFNDQGQYRLLITGGNQGDTLMISLMMGEGDEAMEYMAMTDEDVMIGMSGDSMMADLMAYSGEQPDPAATPAPTLTAAQERAAMRGPSGLQGAPRRSRVRSGRTRCRLAQTVLPERAALLVQTALTALMALDGARGPAGADGSDGSDGSNGARGGAGSAGPAGCRRRHRSCRFCRFCRSGRRRRSARHRSPDHRHRRRGRCGRRIHRRTPERLTAQATQPRQPQGRPTGRPFSLRWTRKTGQLVKWESCS